jgi:hypothetical protein
LAARGLVLWVRVRSPDGEDKAQKSQPPRPWRRARQASRSWPPQMGRRPFGPTIRAVEIDGRRRIGPPGNVGRLIGMADLARFGRKTRGRVLWRPPVTTVSSRASMIFWRWALSSDRAARQQALALGLSLWRTDSETLSEFKSVELPDGEAISGVRCTDAGWLHFRFIVSA